jgi:hypothetical protein
MPDMSCGSAAAQFSDLARAALLALFPLSNTGAEVAIDGGITT